MVNVLIAIGINLKCNEDMGAGKGLNKKAVSVMRNGFLL